jgi:hypothetical protein
LFSLFYVAAAVTNASSATSGRFARLVVLKVGIARSGYGAGGSDRRRARQPQTYRMPGSTGRRN